MQEEVTRKTIALAIKTAKLDGKVLQAALRKLLQLYRKARDTPHCGKQTLKQLMRHGTGVSNIEITDANIKAFESTAKKYGIDFALKKADDRYLVFFKGRDADVLTAAFREFSKKKLDKERLDEIVDLMLETVCSARKTLRIAGDDYPAELVKSKFLKLNSSHIEFVMDCMRENTTKIRNIKQYLRAVLFNAPSTIDNYYTALVAHDMASPDWGKPKSGIPDYSCSPNESL